MLTDTPDQGKDGIQLASAYQGVGTSTPAPATHGTEGVQPDAQGRAAFHSAQQARKVAAALVQNIAAADDATDAAEEQVAKWDATIADLIKKLNAAHEKRAASQKNVARRQALDDHSQDMTANTSNVLEVLQNAKRRRFDCVDSQMHIHAGVLCSSGELMNM